MAKLKKCTVAVISLIGLSASFIQSNSAFSIDLKQVYNQALVQDKTYQQAKFTYESAKTAAPIALAGLLPSVKLAANTTANKNSTINNNKFYNTNSATITLDQTLFNWGTFQTYSQAKFEVLQAEIAYKIAKQDLITSVVQAYFNVLNALDNVNYSEINLTQNKENLSLTQAQFKVGLVAKTDVASAKSGYEQAVATLVNAQNQLENQLEALTVITNKEYKASDFSLLKPGFPLAKPSPANIESWSYAAANNNLSVLSADLQVNIDQKQVSVDAGGYFPNATFEATGKRSVDKSSSSAATKTYTYGANAAWNIGSFARLDDSLGNNTYFTVKKDRLILNSDQAAQEQARRQAISDARTSYLTTLSDISQIKAYRQAVISGNSAVAAAVAKYEAGTETIVNVLQQQSTLYNNRLSLSNGINTFFNDRIKLKASVGQLSEKDIDQLNQLLISDANLAKEKTLKPKATTPSTTPPPPTTKTQTNKSTTTTTPPPLTTKTPTNNAVKNTQPKSQPVKAYNTTSQQQKFDKASEHLNKMLIKEDKKELQKIDTSVNAKSLNQPLAKSLDMPADSTLDQNPGGIHFHNHTHHHYAK